jgi:hypothetical protein
LEENGRETKARQGSQNERDGSNPEELSKKREGEEEDVHKKEEVRKMDSR